MAGQPLKGRFTSLLPYNTLTHKICDVPNTNCSLFISLIHFKTFILSCKVLLELWSYFQKTKPWHISFSFKAPYGMLTFGTYTLDLHFPPKKTHCNSFVRYCPINSNSVPSSITFHLLHKTHTILWNCTLHDPQQEFLCHKMRL